MLVLDICRKHYAVETKPCKELQYSARAGVLVFFFVHYMYILVYLTSKTVDSLKTPFPVLSKV